MSKAARSLNLEHFWMPFTANRAFKANPRIVTGARGMHVFNEKGGRVLDAVAGLWCVNAGHGRPEIARAVHEALSTLDFAPTFQMGHPAAFHLAERLAGMLPKGLDRVFFTNSGSESVDTALKIALAYHQLRGESSRTRLIGREKGYHGVNFGGTSVGGMVRNRTHFGPLLPGVDHLPLPQAKARFTRGLLPPDPAAADELERLVALHGARTIAAVIVEPIAGSAGVYLPPEGYLERLAAVARRHGILLIFDEVITGFGRTGLGAFASGRLGPVPDLMTMAKGLTNGAVPMGAVAVSREVHGVFMEKSPEAIELFHGYTTSGHPAACAAALATLGIYEREGLFERAGRMAPKFQEMLYSFEGRPGIADIRGMGLIGGIELQPQGAPGTAGMKAFTALWEAGLLGRVTGDTLAFSPPLIIEETHIKQIGRLLGEVLGRQYGW